MAKFSILLIGDELITGAISDTNGAFLARELTSIGAEISQISVVGDEHQMIVNELGKLANSSEVIITSGGLGPTSDDITRDAIAEFCGVQTHLDRDSFQRMELRYTERGIPLNKISERQNTFPVNSVVLPNPVGTADTFYITEPKSNCLIIALPGVPKELQEIFRQQISPLITTRHSELKILPTLVLKCFGMSESYFGSQIENLCLPKDIRIGYRPVTPEIWLKFTTTGDRSELMDIRKTVGDAIGEEFIYAEGEATNLSETVGTLLVDRKMTVAFAESCTGGLIAHQIVSNPGCSSHFLASLVAYSNRAKETYLGVAHDTLEKYGAVSAEVAIQMARGARIRSGSSLAVSVTGIAGPDGGTESKPVGTVWFGITDGKREEVIHHRISRERNMFRSFCATYALDLVRRWVLGYRLTWDRR